VTRRRRRERQRAGDTLRRRHGWRRSSQEHGTGLIGSIAGVTVFLSLLTVATQVLVDLYQTSVVTAAAYDAARRVASGTDLDAATAHIVELLGDAGDDASIEWDVSADVVRVHLVVPTRRLLLPAVAGPLGLDEVDRTITVRVEELQE
jgi:hypothetical protein